MMRRVDFKVREFGRGAASGFIPMFIYTIGGENLADSEDSA